MKKLILFILLNLIVGFLSSSASAQNTPVCLTPDDVKAIRKIVADRDYYKAAFEESERQRAAWQKSSADWKALYESEKSRADGVQESRIKALSDANAELSKANFFYKQQADADRQKIGEQNFTIRKLKSERKWFFAAGFGLGALTGYQVKARFNF